MPENGWNPLPQKPCNDTRSTINVQQSDDPTLGPVWIRRVPLNLGQIQGQNPSHLHARNVTWKIIRNVCWVGVTRDDHK